MNNPVSIYEALKSGQVNETSKGFQFDKNSSITAEMENQVPIDFYSLIKHASNEYQISNDPKDYLVVPVPIIISDTPNRNGVAFPAKSLGSFSPSHGMLHFKTWIGKPTYVEHKNNNPKKAKGIILDAVMNKVKNKENFYKVMLLLSFDRTKDRILYDSIISKKNNAYSMGAYFSEYRCSYCNASFSPGKPPNCSHIDTNRINFYKIDNKLVYLEAWKIEGFECSSVGVPAYRFAVSDEVSTIEPLLLTK